MTSVPNQSIVREIKCLMERNTKLYYAQIGGKMCATVTHQIAEYLSHLFRQPLELRQAESAQVCGGIDRGKDWRLGHCSFLKINTGNREAYTSKCQRIKRKSQCAQRILIVSPHLPLSALVQNIPSSSYLCGETICPIQLSRMPTNWAKARSGSARCPNESIHAIALWINSTARHRLFSRPIVAGKVSFPRSASLATRFPMTS